MPTYAFHHYGPGDSPVCVTLDAFASDWEAEKEGWRLLAFHGLRCVDICEGVREVATVKAAPAPWRWLDAEAP